MTTEDFFNWYYGFKSPLEALRNDPPGDFEDAKLEDAWWAAVASADDLADDIDTLEEFSWKDTNNEDTK